MVKKTIRIFSCLIIVLSCSIVVYVASVIIYWSSFAFNDIYGDINFTNIEITNSDGDTIKPDMETTQEEILLMLGDIQFVVNGIYFNQYPTLYHVKFVMGSYARRKSLHILGSNSIAYGGFMYKSSEYSIDLEYLKNLFE
ncbi:MAG: hypothetical protein FWG87_01505 [Defluviitaleaceae bacterium]|nr:hypothetical protein [Defluviitaleaceae bacterium]